MTNIREVCYWEKNTCMLRGLYFVHNFHKPVRIMFRVESPTAALSGSVASAQIA